MYIYIYKYIYIYIYINHLFLLKIVCRSTIIDVITVCTFSAQKYISRNYINIFIAVVFLSIGLTYIIVAFYSEKCFRELSNNIFIV